MAREKPEVESTTRPLPTVESEPDSTERPRERPSWGRRLFWFVATVGLIGVLLVGIGVVGAWPSWLPSLGNPFQEEATDRSQPVLLRSIQDLSRFTAASGDFEVIIDVETSRRFIPDFILGERILFVAAGHVDAYVEFGGLAEGALEVDEVTDTVEITLPAPELTEANLDQERSYVYEEDRGAANRIGDFFGNDPNRLQEVLVMAEDRIGEAAQDSGLRERAEENTRAMLVGMLSSLGFEVVTIEFQAP